MEILKNNKVQTKLCPFCQKEIPEVAHKCKHCGAWFTDNADEKQKLADLENQAQKFISPKQDKTGEDLGHNTQCFTVSTKKLILMSLITIGFYDLYWFFRNWLAILRQENKKISPLGRTIFSVFYCYTLFKRIFTEAIRKGYRQKDISGTMAAVYILLILISNRAPEPFDLIGILSFIPILFINNAARFNNLVVDPYYQESRKLTLGEILFMLTGILMWFGIIMDFIDPVAS